MSWGRLPETRLSDSRRMLFVVLSYFGGFHRGLVAFHAASNPSSGDPLSDSAILLCIARDLEPCETLQLEEVTVSRRSTTLFWEIISPYAT